MPANQINDLMQIWARSLPPGCDPPFADAQDLYHTIDATEVGNIPWESFTVSYNGEVDEDDVDAPWKLKNMMCGFMIHTRFSKRN